MGEHNHAVLNDLLGLDPSAIEALEKEGVLWRQATLGRAVLCRWRDFGGRAPSEYSLQG